MSADILRPISGFADAACWAVQDDIVVYVPQDRSYKEVLKGGTPIEYIVSGEIPTILGASSSPINVRFNWPRAALKPELPTFDFIESDTFVISGSDSCYLDHDALMQLPWMKVWLEDRELSIGFNDSKDGEQIEKIGQDGAIWFRGWGEPVYIAQNFKKSAQPRIVCYRITCDEYIVRSVVDIMETLRTVQLHDDEYGVLTHHYTYSTKESKYLVTHFWDEDYDGYYCDEYDYYDHLDSWRDR